MAVPSRLGQITSPETPRVSASSGAFGLYSSLLYEDQTLDRPRPNSFTDQKWVQEGWPTRGQSDNPDLQPYIRRKDELSTEVGCVLWGSRVIIPTKGRRRALDMLHEAHPGIVRMRSLACG